MYTVFSTPKSTSSSLKLCYFYSSGYNLSNILLIESSQAGRRPRQQSLQESLSLHFFFYFPCSYTPTYFSFFYVQLYLIFLRNGRSTSFGCIFYTAPIHSFCQSGLRHFPHMSILSKKNFFTHSATPQFVLSPSSVFLQHSHNS